MGGPGWFRANSAAATAALGMFRTPDEGAGITVTYEDSEGRELWPSTSDKPCIVTCQQDGEDAIRYHVEALWPRPKTGMPHATIITRDRRVYSERKDGPNGHFETWEPCEKLRRCEP